MRVRAPSEGCCPGSSTAAPPGRGDALIGERTAGSAENFAAPTLGLAHQLRLWPAPKPLVARFGVEFFRRVPVTAGVYLMGGEQDRLLYIGKASNLRQRLDWYRHVAPDRHARKLVRLVHEVRSITWETCPTADAALLRENELLRRHKPKYNVHNTRPEHYVFVHVGREEGGWRLRWSQQPRGRAGESTYGALKGAQSTTEALLALARVWWLVGHRPSTPFDLPHPLVASVGRGDIRLDDSPSDPVGLDPWLPRWLAGESPALIEALRDALALPPFNAGFWASFLAGQWEALQHFYDFGTRRVRDLRAHFAIDEPWIAATELDDLLALRAAAARPASLRREHGSPTPA